MLVEDINDIAPGPLEEDVIFNCPECGQETTAKQLYLMGCCHNCSHRAGDC